MADIRKIREEYSKDDGDWEEWPFPTVTIESVVSGELRSKILAKLGRDEDKAEVHLIESQVSGGYSEFTQQDECTVEVKIGEETAWKSAWGWDKDSAMVDFLKWADPKPI